jgi:multidrug resistance efflux pump
MRLSEEKARRLNALVWRERVKRWVPVTAVVVGAIALLTFFLVRQVEHADRTLDVRVHQATVVHVKKSGNGRAAAIVEVRLDDGRDVEALSVLRLDPMAGAHVIINEARHASGRMTYDIARLAE